MDIIPLSSLLLRVTNLTPVHRHLLSECLPHSLPAVHDLVFQTKLSSLLFSSVLIFDIHFVCLVSVSSLAHNFSQ